MQSFARMFVQKQSNLHVVVSLIQSKHRVAPFHMDQAGQARWSIGQLRVLPSHGAYNHLDSMACQLMILSFPSIILRPTNMIESRILYAKMRETFKQITHWLTCVHVWTRWHKSRNTRIIITHDWSPVALA